MRMWVSDESIFLHMSLSLFSFKLETLNLCARKPHPRLYTGGARVRERAVKQVSNRTRWRKSKRRKYVRRLVHRREWCEAAGRQSFKGRVNILEMGFVWGRQGE